MAEFKLGRIRFVWKGNWQPGNTYYKDDVVAFAIDGVQYPDLQFIRGYTYTFNQDDSSNTTHPLLFSTQKNGTHSGGTAFETGVSYFLDGVEVADGDAYNAGFNTATQRRVEIAVSADTPDPLYYYCYNHSNMAVNAEIDVTTIGLTQDIQNWELFAEGLEWKNNWTPDFEYKINDFVKYGGIAYVCIEAHKAADTYSLGLEQDSDKWQVFNAGFEYRQDWQSSIRYRLNDVVKYGAGLWIATQEHTSAALFETDLDSTYWEKFVEGFQFESEWDATRQYQTGDIVTYGGNQYIAISDNQGEFPSTATTEWQLFSQGLKFQGDWNEDSSQVEYRVGEVVRLGGFTYRCIKDHSNQQPPNEEFWQRLNSGFEWRGEWIDGAEYYEGDVARFGDNSYVAVSYHIAEDGVNSPDIADSSEFWSVFAIGTEQSVLNTTGDLVYYSGSAPVRLPIGEDGQILQVNAEGIPEWAFLDQVSDVYYVTEFGTNQPAPIYGKSIDRPWGSIRYAAEQVEKGAKVPAAAKLLEFNRRFIQREIVEYVDYEIANGIAPFTTDFEYDSAKFERDMGFLIDAFVWDLTHGGNVRSREAALGYVGNEDYFDAAGQQEETVAAIQYGLTVIEAVLKQEAPTVNYQELNGDNSTRIVEQYFDPTLGIQADEEYESTVSGSGAGIYSSGGSSGSDGSGTGGIY